MDKPLVLDDLDGYKFEELVARIMKKKGYNEIKVTSKSRDFGRDIIMTGMNNEIVLVECKHQNFVGRPIIQKLQGAIAHEEIKKPDREVKGIIVTSGSFSKEALDYNNDLGNKIELIDGRKLKDLCTKLGIVILNGKVQILTNNSFKNLSKEESKETSRKEFSRIYWSKAHKPTIEANLKFYPAFHIEYAVNFMTTTSAGTIDDYSAKGSLTFEGTRGDLLSKELSNFFFSSGSGLEEIEHANIDKKIPFQFTENDIEDYAMNLIIQQHTHKVYYQGKNNVSYSKTCIPKRGEIDIRKFVPMYLPVWTNTIEVMKFAYKQEFYTRGKAQLYSKDELRECKICEEQKVDYEEMNLCPECGRITCKKHTKIDYLDKATPICNIHAKTLKLWLQNKNFAKKENLNEYKKLWESKNFFQKLYEDKIVFGLVLAIGLICIIGLIALLSN